MKTALGFDGDRLLVVPLAGGGTHHAHVSELGQRHRGESVRYALDLAWSLGASGGPRIRARGRTRGKIARFGQHWGKHGGSPPLPPGDAGRTSFAVAGNRCLALTLKEAPSVTTAWEGAEEWRPLRAALISCRAAWERDIVLRAFDG